MKNRIPGLVAGLLYIVFSPCLHAGVVTSFNDITTWVGTGSNQAGLVIDFHDGTTRQSFAWGFRWDGVASGADMILAIDQFDMALSLTATGTAASGFYLTGVSYTENAVTHSQAGGTFLSYPEDYTAWNYYLAGGSAGNQAISGGGNALPGVWTVSPTGASLDSFGDLGRVLSNNAWDAWSFGYLDENYAPVTPPDSTVYAAIPEPQTASLLVLAAISLAWLCYAKKRIYHN